MDLLKNYKVKGKYEYELEPGVEYDEIQAWVVPIGATYFVHAELDLGDKTEVDHSAWIRVDQDSK